MNRIRTVFEENLFPILVLVGLVAAWSLTASGEEVPLLTLDQYLTQVKEQNTGVRASIESTAAGDMRSEEGKLLLAPTVFVSASYKQDSSYQPTNLNFVEYQWLDTGNLSFGVSQQTVFGSQLKLSYNMITSYEVNPNPSSFSLGGPSIPLNLPANSYYLSLDVTQNLWSNGLGRSTRATQDQLTAQALASSFGASFQAKSNLSSAELTYWRLALARQLVKIQGEAVDRARKIYEYTSKRSKNHLGDEGDRIQAEAQLKTQELSLQSSKDEILLASRAFNSARNIDSDIVKDNLVSIDDKALENSKAPGRAQFRDDVRSALQNAKANEANAIISLERDSPTLDFTGNVSSYGQTGVLSGNSGGNPGTAFLNSFGINGPAQPAFTLALKFQAPIDLPILAKSREGWRKEQDAAELTYQRKLFDQDQDWKNLVDQLSNARRHLELSTQITKIQYAKLLHEKERLSTGRTTTYQVLLFETDYLQAELTRVRDEATVLNTIAQMKTFGETI